LKVQFALASAKFGIVIWYLLIEISCTLVVLCIICVVVNISYVCLVLKLVMFKSGKVCLGGWKGQSKVMELWEGHGWGIWHQSTIEVHRIFCSLCFYCLGDVKCYVEHVCE